MHGLVFAAAFLWSCNGGIYVVIENTDDVSLTARVSDEHHEITKVVEVAPREQIVVLLPLEPGDTSITVSIRAKQGEEHTTGSYVDGGWGPPLCVLANRREVTHTTCDP